MKCPKCNNEHDRYSEEHDAEWCSKCNEWCINTCSLADCGDLNCEFCSERPDHPVPLSNEL